MAEPSPAKPIRRKLPLTISNHVPRPFEKWLRAIFLGEKWIDRRPRIEWLITLRKFAKEHGCRIIFDPRFHWRESVYVFDYREHGPAVLVGGAGELNDCCSALLHELGHHMIRERHWEPKDMLACEEAAWEAAHEIAARFRLPLSPHVRRQALYSYRYRIVRDTTVGSKSKNRRRPMPKSWQLQNSRRSAQVSSGHKPASNGKKGKRHAKRGIKRATARAERHAPVDREE